MMVSKAPQILFMIMTGLVLFFYVLPLTPSCLIKKKLSVGI